MSWNFTKNLFVNFESVSRIFTLGMRWTHKVIPILDLKLTYIEKFWKASRWSTPWCQEWRYYNLKLLFLRFCGDEKQTFHQFDNKINEVLNIIPLLIIYGITSCFYTILTRKNAKISFLRYFIAFILRSKQYFHFQRKTYHEKKKKNNVQKKRNKYNSSFLIQNFLQQIRESSFGS